MKKIDYLTEVPSWANNMVRNYREQANIPSSISDLDLFKAIETEEIYMIDDPDFQTEILRHTLKLN